MILRSLNLYVYAWEFFVHDDLIFRNLVFPLLQMVKHIIFVEQYLLHQLTTQLVPYWVALSKLHLHLGTVDIVMGLKWIYSQRCDMHT